LTAPTEIDVWNVEHGVCIHLVTPNNKHVLIDCGSSADFSPAIYLYEDLKIKKLDYVILSHPHEDHIRDVENIKLLFDVKVLQRNRKIDLEDLKEENKDVEKPPNDKRLEAYFDLNKRFTKDVEWINDPKNPEWGRGCSVRTFFNNDENLEVNDRSVSTFIDFGNERILYGADIKEKGWDELITKNKDFREFAQKTTIYIAAHHGNKSGYSSKLFELFKPKLTIISAGRYREFDGTSLYDAVTKGMTIHNGKESKSAKVISTRNNGNMKITMYDDKDTVIKIDNF
jgi:competence protein ComEC